MRGRRAAPLWAAAGPRGMLLAAAVLASPPDLRAVAARAVPTVASLQITGRAGGAGRGGSAADPFDLPGRDVGGPVTAPVRGLGSGFVLDQNGLLLTNYHVIEDAAAIEVTLTGADGIERTRAARVLGVAPRYDVALLTTDAPLDAVALPLGDSDAMMIGDWVMAVGNPFGLSHSVSVGIISAIERRDIAPSGRHGVYSFLQTDASINPGNSGGPLMNLRGEVVGINSAINAAGSGIGFAIPINMVKQMLPDLRTRGRFSRRWLGVKVQALTQELAESFALAHAHGALVTEVVPDSPAAAAGLRMGDVVLSFDGRPLRQAGELIMMVSMAECGREASLAVWRDGALMAAHVALAEFPEADHDPPDAMAAPEPPAPEGFGLRLADLSARARRPLAGGAGGGALVRDVAVGSLAARAGLRPGDVVVEINGVPTPTTRAAVAAARAAPAGGLVRFRLDRHGAVAFAALRRSGGQPNPATPG